MLTFPPDISQPQVRKLAVEHADLTGRLAEARRTAKECERALDRAREEDGRQYAERLRAGKGKPDGKAVTEAEQALEDARRLVTALADALRATEGDLESAVDACRTEWLDQLDEEHEQRRGVFADAVEALATAHSELMATRATAVWVRYFRSTAAGPKGVYKVQPGTVTSWKLPNGSSPATTQVIDALRQLAQPEERHRPEAFTAPTAPPIQPLRPVAR